MREQKPNVDTVRGIVRYIIQRWQKKKKVDNIKTLVVF